MQIEGQVGLDAVVWLSHSPEAQTAIALAAAVVGSDWIVWRDERARARMHGDTVEIEARAGNAWSGLVTGRVRTKAAAPSTAPFRPYTLPPVSAPLRLESCWFAVDADGRVACFDRDQLGAAPIKRCWGPRPAPELQLASPESMIEAVHGQHAPPRPPARSYTFVAESARLLKELARAAPRTAARRWSLHVVDERAVVSTGFGSVGGEPVPPTLLAWIHARGICLGCARAPTHDDRLRGAFVYQHQGRLWAAPYERVSEPVDAWTVDAAASALGLHSSVLASSVLPVSFGKKDRLQPIEYVRCTWSETVPWEAESGARHGQRA